MSKFHGALVVFVIALAAIWVSNHVAFVKNITG
jgi:hypothetical protein